MNTPARRPLRNSIAAMGFERRFNENYAAYGTPELSPVEVLVAMFDDGANNSEIGRVFDRTPHAVRKWRMWYESR